MTDCSNVEMRDRLPDLLHERLDASARAAVMAHVARCPECHAELALLREARIALTSGVRSLDIAMLTTAVLARTSAPVVRELPSQRRARTWMDWRVAASIALVAIGGASFAAIRAHLSAPLQTASAPAPIVVADSPKLPGVAPKPKPIATRPVPTRTAPAAELSAAGGVSDLSDSDLRALLDDLQSMDAELSTDPEPVSVRITLPGRGGVD